MSRSRETGSCRLEVRFPWGDSEGWTISVVVDDDPLCADAATDSTRVIEIFIPHLDFPMAARGDANQDRRLDLSDAFTIFSFLFLGDRLDCLSAADCNVDGSLDVSDGIYLLDFLFLGGRAPQYPFPSCGFSSNESDLLLGCAGSPACP